MFQDDVLLNGHAIQCRINAEDPKSFIPSLEKSPTGMLLGGFGVRVDSHVYVNYTVPPNYDSLIGKIIVYGNNREQAIFKMQVALVGKQSWKVLIRIYLCTGNY